MRGASLELPEGLVRDGEVVEPRRPRRGAQELRRRGRTAEERPARSGEPADRRPRGRASAHRGREAARRRRPLPGGRGDRNAARRGRARPSGRRLHRGARRLPAHAGRARGRAPLDDRGAARGRQARRPEARGHRPRRLRARAHPRGRRRRPARTTARASTATSAASATWRSPSATACFFTRPLSAVWDDEDAGARLADEIRLSIDYYMTQPQAKPVGEVVLSGPGSADDAARREPRRAPRPPDHGRGAARRPRPLGARRGRGPAPPHRGRRTRDGEGRMKAVNLIPQRAAARDTPAARARAARTSCSACSASCS